MYQVKFKHADQSNVNPKLLAAVNKLCEDKKQNANCVSGFRSLENQKATNKSVLQTTKGSVQREDGSVWLKKKCLAAAYGKSNHCFGLAMDIDDIWFKSLTNAQLASYGLVKPMDYEPWHVERVKNIEIKEFQATYGLTADGIAGPKTITKAKEVQETINLILKGVK